MHAPRAHSNLSLLFAIHPTGVRRDSYVHADTVLQIAARMKVEKDVMQEQREAEEELAVLMNRRLVKEVGPETFKKKKKRLPSTTPARTRVQRHERNSLVSPRWKAGPEVPS